jgi:hypothetical protein
MVTDRIEFQNTRTFKHNVKCDLFFLTRIVTSEVSANGSIPHRERPKRIGYSYRRLKSTSFLSKLESK